MIEVSKPGRSRWLWLSGMVVAGLILGVGFFMVSTWGQVYRVDIERPAAVAAASETTIADSPDDTAVPEFRLPPVPSATDEIDTILLVGTDSREGLEGEGFGDFDGARADVLLLLVRPRNGDQSALVSLPRDLWVSTPCGKERINEALEGCDTINGETTLLVTIESLTGLGIDHLGLVDMEGFQQVVDDIGGYEICLDQPVRDQRAQLELAAGCTMASGAETLAWLRSRSTQVLTEGGNWVTMSGVSDLTRNERQRDFLIAMLERLSDFGDPQDAVAMARQLAPHVTVDSRLGITQAVSLAWTMRGLGDSVTEISIPVADYVTEAGANVLIASSDIEDIIAEIVAVEMVGEAPGGQTG